VAPTAGENHVTFAAGLLGAGGESRLKPVSLEVTSKS